MTNNFKDDKIFKVKILSVICLIELRRYSNRTGIPLIERQFEERHKLVKKAVLKPYEDFETVYKKYSTEVYRKTIDYIDKKTPDIETKLENS